MTTATDLALVVELACLAEDRTRAEQAALLRVAARCDAAINRQTASNPHLDRGRGSFPPPCTGSADHPKSCVCRGDGVAWEPRGGWSRLADAAAATWVDEA